MENKEWLEQLKAGDMVYVSNSSSVPDKYKISKITATQIIITLRVINGASYSLRFDKNSGRLRGGSAWRSRYLLKPCQELDDARIIYNLRNRAQQLIEDLDIPKTKEKLYAFLEVLENLKKAMAE